MLFEVYILCILRYYVKIKHFCVIWPCFRVIFIQKCDFTHKERESGDFYSNFKRHELSATPVEEDKNIILKFQQRQMSKNMLYFYYKHW